MPRETQGAFAQKIDEIFARHGWKNSELAPHASASLIQKIRRQHHLPSDRQIGRIVQGLKEKQIVTTFDELITLSNKQKRSQALRKQRKTKGKQLSIPDFLQNTLSDLQIFEEPDWIVEHPFYEGICKHVDSFYNSEALTKLIALTGAERSTVISVMKGMAEIWANSAGRDVLVVDLRFKHEVAQDVDLIDVLHRYSEEISGPHVKRLYHIQCEIFPQFRIMKTIVERFRATGFEYILLTLPGISTCGSVLKIASLASHVLFAADQAGLKEDSFDGLKKLPPSTWPRWVKKIAIKNLPRT